MSDVDEMGLGGIEQRLDELRAKKDRAEDFRDLVGEASDNLSDIQSSEFVGDEAAAKVDLLQSMLERVVQRHTHAEKAIRYEREQLRRRRAELERQQEGDTDE